MEYMHSAALGSKPVFTTGETNNPVIENRNDPQECPLVDRIAEFRLGEAHLLDDDGDELPLGTNVDYHAINCRKVMRLPNLERDEELALARRWRCDRDLAARNKLINAHLKLVLAMASKYRRSGHLDDLMSAGTLGLIKATDSFDPEKGVRFSTWARYEIRAAVNQYVEQNRSIVRPRTGSKPPMDDSLNETLDGEDGDADTRQDRLVDERPNPEAILVETDFRRHMNRVVEKALKGRDLQIVKARYLADEPSTREDLAGALGVSSERIRQIEARALAKVKKAAANYLEAA